MLTRIYPTKKEKSQAILWLFTTREKEKGIHTLLLGESIDKRLQLYLKAIGANGGPVTAGIAIAAARGLLLVENKSKLFEYGGHIKLNRSWA